MTGSDPTGRANTVLHVIVPQREGAIGGSDLHVLDLAVAQQRDGERQPLILAPRATQDYLERLHDAGLTVLPPLRPGWLWRLPRTHNVGMLHGHGYEANYLIAAMRQICPTWARLPAVVTAHGWIETTSWLRVKSALDRLSMRTVDLRIASAHAHLRQLRSVGEPTVAIHNGIPAPRMFPEEATAAGLDFRKRYGIASAHLVLGTIGRLSTEKRVDLFLKAGQKIVSARSDIHLLVVGGGAQRAELENLAARLGVRDRTTFTGLIKDVRPALSALNFLVQPSDTEGSPRSVLEAMSHGVLVVASDVGDVGTLLGNGDAGVLVPRNDADALAHALLSLIDHPARGRALAHNARARYCQLYTVEIMRAGVHDVYAAAEQAARRRGDR